MDPVAHTLVGASLAATGLKRLSRFGAATLVIGANLPDLDAVAYLAGSDTALLVRRGWTHGVAALFVLPFLLAGAMVLLGRSPSRRGAGGVPAVRGGPLLLLAFLAVWSHPALDLLNTYGVRLLMPFDGRWFYGDTLFIVDPWFWLLAGVGAAVAARGGRAQTWAWSALALLTTAFVISSPFGSWTARIVWVACVSAIVVARTRLDTERHAPTLALVGLSALLVYIAAMRSGSVVARERARAWLAARDVVPVTLMAGPLPLDPWRRDVIVGLADRYEFLVVDLRNGEISAGGSTLRRGDEHPAVAVALSNPEVRGFRTWMRYPSFDVAETATGVHVLMRDVRYAREGERGFAVAEVTVDVRPPSDRPTAPR